MARQYNNDLIPTVLVALFNGDAITSIRVDISISEYFPDIREE